MLVATPGQTTAYSTLHNSSGGGSGVGSGNSANATVANKKTNTMSLNLNASKTTASSGIAKSLNSNNTNHTTSAAINKKSLNSNTHTTSYNHQQNCSKSDNNVSTTKHSNNINNTNNRILTATSARDKIISAIMPAKITSHSFKNENSTTSSASSASTKQSFIQTLKDSVQKALISTTGRSTITNNNKKPNNNSNNATTTTTINTSIQKVTSSTTTTTLAVNNANKVSTTTTSSTTSSNSTSTAATTQPSSSSSSSFLPLVRSKYFSCSLSKLHTVAPTIIHRYPEERQHASSTDSLQKEMCHFKPIRIAPTTPWKTGSKSRGSSLRFPKANLATGKSEFILKSNCDVNNKKKKKQAIRTQIDDDKYGRDADDNNEQENKEFYGIYKPKPSLTCLSTSYNTPNHQSAFVCLLAGEMKNLVEIQSKKTMKLAKSAGTTGTVMPANTALNMEATTSAAKAKNTRLGRTIIAATCTTISNITPPPATDEIVKELSVKQNKQKPAKKLVQQHQQATKKTEIDIKQTPKKRSTRLASNAVNKSFSTSKSAAIKNKSKENVKQTNAKANEIAKLSKVSITKAKSRRKVVDRANTKSKLIVNMVALANSTASSSSSTKAKEKLQKSKSDTLAISIQPRNKRKLKNSTTSAAVTEATAGAITLSSSPIPLSLPPTTTTTASVKSLLRGRRKHKQNNTTTVPTKKLKTNSKASLACFSPPLTRARLKSLEAQGKTITVATAMMDTKKRRI